MPAPRWPAALLGVALLGVAPTACGKQALGMIDAGDGVGHAEKVSNTPAEGCHRFRAGVTRVANYTQNDIVLYRTADCTVPPGGQSDYLSAQSSDAVVRSTPPWRSFSVVH